MNTAAERARMGSLIDEHLTAQTPGGGSGRVGNIAPAALPGESVSARWKQRFPA